MTTKNIKTIGRFTIDYSHIYVKEPEKGFWSTLSFFMTMTVLFRDVKSVRVFLQKDGHYITSETFPLSEDPEVNKKNMADAVSQLEKMAIRLNNECDKRERDEEIMLSGVKSGTNHHEEK